MGDEVARTDPDTAHLSNVVDCPICGEGYESDPDSPFPQLVCPTCRDHLRSTIRQQLVEIQTTHAVTCSCGRGPLSVGNVWRCYFCGVWFCRKCAKAHFGDGGPHDGRAKKGRPTGGR